MSLMDLAAIKARCEAATPGPWEPDGSEIYVALSREWIAESCRYEFGPDDQSRPTDAGDRDADFIAHARTDVPALVAEVERLWALLRERSEVGGSRPRGMTP